MKYVLYILLLAVVVAGAAGLRHLYRVSAANKREMAQYAGKSAEIKKDLGRVLVVYYSLTGHTKEIADKIQTMTNADIFGLETAKPLPTGAKLHLTVKDQLKTKKYPALKQLPDLTGYDVVFVGSPVWWYTAATPVLSFLEQADFQGAKVAFFSTQGSNRGTFLQDVEALTKNAEILHDASFNNMGKEYDAAVNAKIAAWINGL